MNAVSQNVFLLWLQLACTWLLMANRLVHFPHCYFFHFQAPFGRLMQQKQICDLGYLLNLLLAQRCE